ncbi:uncharacterized protein M421DRAFT_156955 [Didymella exigua CBS 183.55]|uniref:Uncharacterized protein n=1 Tax=Didymella exigua CBS 183.55 TaxID=1150837 RepID=A0A6A5RIQ6_9PLEO|nr:uncharacterized protein M421DRAFT_156955 [Didymella exigua CBS 183.55]KAF1928241.1 hypothetical protein M421DRAFT_156955 [Didymella exigua CBS 183.55]
MSNRLFGFRVGGCTTKYADDLKNLSEESKQLPELRGGGDNREFERYHPRERANFEAVKHRLSPEKRRHIERWFDRAADLNPSWVHRSTTVYGQPPLTTTAMAQHLSLSTVLKISLKTKVERWLNSINNDSLPEHEPSTPPDVSDDEHARGDGNGQKGVETTLVLRGGGDNYEWDLQHERRRIVIYLQDRRRLVLLELLEGADTGTPIRMPEQIRYGRRRAYPLEAFASFLDTKVDRRTVIERWLDTVVLEETVVASREDQPILRGRVQLLTSLENISPLCIELQLTSAANDALELALAASEGYLFTIAVDEIDQELSSEQNEPIAQAEDLHDSGFWSSATSPGLDNDGQSPSEEPSDTSSQRSDTLCPTVASDESIRTLINITAPRPATITTPRPVVLSRGDIWDAYAC